MQFFGPEINSEPGFIHTVHCFFHIKHDNSLLNYSKLSSETSEGQKSDIQEFTILEPRETLDVNQGSDSLET